MIAWSRHHVRSFAAALRRLGRGPLALALNVVAVGIALALPLGGYLFIENLARLVERAGTEPQLSVFFALDADETDVKRVQSELSRALAVKGMQFVSRDDALQALRGSPELGEIIAALKSNPLPDALVVDLAAGNIDAVERLASSLGRLPKVARVQFDAAWARRVDASLRLGKLAVALLAGLLAVGLVAVTFNAVRLQILTQREEIELAKLVGATDAYVRRPFLYQGAALGVLGGFAATGIVLGSAALLDAEVTRLAQSYGSNFRLRLMPVEDWITLLGFAGILGWSGAYASVSRYLHRGGAE